MFSAYNILMDFIFAIYPWLIMWKLDMKKSEKLGLCVVMSLVCNAAYYPHPYSHHIYIPPTPIYHPPNLPLTLPKQGMVIAIESAIRTHWKYQGNPKDELYFWRLGMSAIWYSSEVAGTIIVQCVPVLRALVSDVRSTLRSTEPSRRLASTDDFELDGRVEQQWYHAK